MPDAPDNALVRLTGSRPRLWVAAGIGLAVAALPPYSLSPTIRGLAAWCVGSGLYLLLIGHKLLRADAEQTRNHSVAEDPSRGMLDTILTVASAASLVGVFFALVEAGQAKTLLTYAEIALAICATALSWLLTHVLYAIHYARMYHYPAGDGDARGGLDFHCDEPPDYRDFLYFSICIACTFGATDVELTGRHFRRAATGHTLLSFAYATINLALAVNVATSLLSGK